jgi:hypothetical protein
VRDGDAERMAKERRDGEPVGEAAHDPGLGDGEDPSAPPAASPGEHGHGDGRGGEQDGEGEAPLVPRLAGIDGELDQLAAQTSTR